MMLESAELATLRFESPLGTMILAGNERALTGVWFEGQKHFPGPDPAWRDDAATATLVAAREQLLAFFAGRRQTFTVPLAAPGTVFQQRVWQALLTIPFGQTISYGALARGLGNERGVRAAAAAIGRNPISIIVPCHRVVGADGSLTGYAGGLDRKMSLLQLEARGREAASPGH